MKADRGKLDGLLSAMIVVAEVTGPMKIGDLTDQAWKAICEINSRLSRMAADEAERLES